MQPETRRHADMQRQLQGYRLTTAEILYHLPDHPAVLQSFVWQELDIAPHYPVLRRFLEFWEREIEGRLHSVRLGLGRADQRSGIAAHDAFASPALSIAAAAGDARRSRAYSSTPERRPRPRTAPHPARPRRPVRVALPVPASTNTRVCGR